jgi:PAS domain S-box-containing protein
VVEPAEISSQAQLVLVHAGSRVSAAEETCWQLRDILPTLPVVTASPGTYASEGARLITAGARDHVRLPAHPQDLRFRIEAHLSYSREQVSELPSDILRSLSDGGPVPLIDLLGSLVDTLPHPVLAIDRGGHLLLFNRASERLLGCPRQAALQDHVVGDFFADPTEVPRLERALVVARAGEACSHDVRVRTMIGEHVPVRFYGSAVRDAKGKVVAFVGLLQDMREFETMSRRLEETTRQLIETEVRAKEAIGGRNMAHELNQPLTVAMGSIELLCTRGDIPQEVTERLEKIYDQLRRMADLVRELPYERHSGRGGSPLPDAPSS